MAASVTTEQLFEIAKARRTIYALNKDLGSVTPARIQEIVKQATLHTPSSFNSQSNRVIILLGAEHDKFWDIVSDALKAIVPAEAWEATAGRIAGFKGAAGSILFFDDDEDVKKMQAGFAAYADKFPGWASQSNGMQQWITWAALHNEGLGANLQHYSPIVDEQVAKEWNLPASWKLNAQLVFGGRVAEAGEKNFKPLEDRVKVYGA